MVIFPALIQDHTLFYTGFLNWLDILCKFKEHVELKALHNYYM